MFSNSKMSQIDPRGGVSIFSNKSQIQKSLKYPIGGGGTSLFGTLSQIFLFFNYDASPTVNELKEVNRKLGGHHLYMVSRRQEEQPNMNFAVAFLKMHFMLWRA